MPRTKQTKTTAPATTATVVAPTSAPKAKRTKKSTKTEVAAAPVETAVAVETAAAVAAPVEATPLSELTEVFSEFSGRLNQLTSQFTSLKNDFRALEKRALRELKAAQKLTAKKARKNTNRQPSGFVKPTKISDELATFLGKDLGSEMARTEVTREINKYIRANALQDKSNGRKINPDAALSSLLKLGSGDELTYFNLQRYMSPHFAKLGQEVPAANQQ